MNNVSSRLATLKTFFKIQRWLTSADLKNLFTNTYWFQNPPPVQSPYLVLTIIVVALVVIILLVWLLKLRVRQRALPVYGTLVAQLPTLIILLIILNLLYAFFRAESISYLASPWVFLVVWLIIGGWWVGLFIYQRRKIPAKIATYEQQMRFKRYLPTSKKKAIGSSLN